ncbi:MAG: DUF4375 domain-containing protein [Akkermansiaceae bacterium]
MDSFDIVDSYFCKVCELPEAELDSASLSIVEVWHSSGLIGNGGLHSYLCSVGDQAYSVADHYRFSGLHDAAKLIAKATDLWRQYWPTGPADDSEPDAFRSQFGEELDKIESEYFELKDGFADKLAEIIPNSKQ